MNYDEAPGFRFYPTEEELISFYLQQKLEGRMQEDLDRVIPVLYIYDYNPWHLPRKLHSYFLVMFSIFIYNYTFYV